MRKREITKQTTLWTLDSGHWAVRGLVFHCLNVECYVWATPMKIYLVNLHATSSVTNVSMTEPGRLGFSALHQSEVSIEVTVTNQRSVLRSQWPIRGKYWGHSDQSDVSINVTVTNQRSVLRSSDQSEVSIEVKWPIRGQYWGHSDQSEVSITTYLHFSDLLFSLTEGE